MWFIPLQVGIPIWPPTYMWVGDTRPSVYPSSLRTHTYSAISTEESYCPSSLVSVERPLRRDRSTIRPLGFAERILRDLSILFLSSAILLSLNTILRRLSWSACKNYEDEIMDGEKLKYDQASKMVDAITCPSLEINVESLHKFACVMWECEECKDMYKPISYDADCLDRIKI